VILAIAAELNLHLLAIDLASAFLYPDSAGPTLIIKCPPALRTKTCRSLLRLEDVPNFTIVNDTELANHADEYMKYLHINHI